MTALTILLTLALTPSLVAEETVDRQVFDMGGIEVAAEGDRASFTLQTEVTEVEPGLSIATLRLTSPEPAEPPLLTLALSMPSHDIHGVWTTGAQFNKSLGPDWYPSTIASTMTRHAPVIALFGADDGNRLTLAVSEALDPVQLTAGVREEDARVYARVELFAERRDAVGSIEIDLRIDRRDQPLHRSLGEVADWWAARPGFEPAPVPERARLPMYSTWYSYHQSVSAEALLGEIRIGKELGFDAIIIDDGWQTLDSQRGYAYTGDWKPERMPEMKAFVDAAHQLGVDVLLWYSLPLVGEKSEVFNRFEGRYLRHWEEQGAWVLDPRYPEVREHIIDTYRRAIADWGIDGFKLDFLGFLVANEETELTAEDGRDFASVDRAVDRLMTDIMVELREVVPEIMIEFRQPYIGPLMRKYGNMFRAGDTPNAAVENRVRVVDLRMLAGGTAVHSDMFMWHSEEPVETAALQILNILFSVPQLSVRLADIPDDHRQMVRFYADYWRLNRETLLDGDFTPRFPLANYPRLDACTPAKCIVAVYQDLVVDLDREPLPDAVDVVNATPLGRLVVGAPSEVGTFAYTTFDVLGREVRAGQIELGATPVRIDVPPSGLLRLERR